MSAPDSHPDKNVIAAFALGRLDDSSSSSVAEHIEHCDSCCEALQTIPDDRFSMLARAAGHEKSSATGAQEIGNDVHDRFRSLARYRILEKIGSGGMGDVYRAEHKLMGRQVAIKVINRNLTGNAEAVSRFRNEVRAAARLNHPNIVQSFDAENVDDIHFLVMELVEGRSLATVVKENGPVDPTRVIEIARDVAAGLQVANQQGMVHRDIKPHNLMVDESGNAKILDFGLARFEREQLSIASIEPQSGGLTGTNIAIGTPDYLAPEQAKDAANADIRSDIYSLGCTIYFLLTGRPPFPDGDPMEKISHHMVSQPTAISDLRKDVPVSLIRMVERMMVKDPQERLQSPDDLLAQLKQIDLRIADNANPGSDDKKAQPHLKTHRRTFLIRTAGVLLATAVAALLALSLFPDLLMSNQPRVLIVSPNRVFYADYEAVSDSLEKRNVEVVTTSQKKWIESVDETPVDPFETDKLLRDIEPENFDAVIFVGGHNDQLSGEGEAADDVARVVEAMRKKPNGVLGAMCAGTGVLQELGFDEILAGDNDLYGYEVFSADRVVTATEPRFAERFADALLEAMKPPKQ